MTEKEIYSKQDQQRDSEQFNQFINGKSSFDLPAFKRLMIHELCTTTDILRTRRLADYPIDKVIHALHHPESHYRLLFDVSKHLVDTSEFYRRLVLYFANMPLFNYNIKPYDVKLEKAGIESRLERAYYNVISMFEKMKIKHEMKKIMYHLLVDDVFYGLIFEDSSDFFILGLNPHICKIKQIQDGVYNYKLNLADISPLKIAEYPQIIQEAYIKFKKQEDYLDGWYIPPADKQVCFKLNEGCIYPLPLFLPLLQDIFDLDAYKKLKLQKARVDNYKALAVEVPIDKNAIDKPLLTYEALGAFAEMNSASMPEDIGYLHVPGSAQAISFKDNANTTNNLADAVTNLYDNAGTSKEIFNSGSSGTAFKLSLENDASIIYTFYRQCERYFSRFIKMRKFNKSEFKFAFVIQDSTVFNRNDISDAYLKASQNGLPFKLDYGVSLGATPSQIMGALFLENDIFKLQDKFVPLTTSYTSSSTDITGGRPTNESQGLDLEESGEITRDNETNLNR